MQRDPIPHPHADAGELGALHEDADLAGLALALQAKTRKRGDQPVFERADERPHIAAAPREVEHHIGHALARAVIGEAPAAAGLEDGKAVGREQLRRIGAGARRVDGGVLEQPDAVLSLAAGDCRGASIHEGERVGIGHRRRARQPFDLRRGMRLSCKGGHGHERFDFHLGCGILG